MLERAIAGAALRPVRSGIKIVACAVCAAFVVFLLVYGWKASNLGTVPFM